MYLSQIDVENSTQSSATGTEENILQSKGHIMVTSTDNALRHVKSRSEMYT